jgi:uncharacterized protein (TIGR00730 family)
MNKYASEASSARSIQTICVYCGSSAGGEPGYHQAARTLGQAMAAAGIGLVYGGGNLGLMGSIASAVAEAGGKVTGIIPEFLVSDKIALAAEHETIVVPDMHARKRMMFERADAFVALPGGIGTLEELVEQLTWVQLGRHSKPVVLADIGGFWRPLLSLFAHMREQGFIPPHYEVRYLVADHIEAVLPMIEAAAAYNERRGPAQSSLDPRL